MDLIQLAKQTKAASFHIMNATSQQKNELLSQIAIQLTNATQDILDANALDVEIGRNNLMSDGLIDRLRLTQERMEQIITGIHQLIVLADPIGEISDMKTMPNGLQIGQMRVSLGVVGMIYEARPNVSVDAAVLCLKAGNAVMLRGSKDILNSNKAIVQAMQKALVLCGFDIHTITLLEDTSRETATQFMKLHEYLDVLIPRGSASLIQTALQQASVPVLETGTGNCFVYVDQHADLEKALNIIVNAKTTRTSVCNACESVLFHKAIKSTFILDVIHALQVHQVRIHADQCICDLSPVCELATQEDYAKEYLALEISMKMVENLEEAITHINAYSTHHSESIVSENYTAVKKFLKEVDSACVYANASTRFSDGFEFGLGAEIGISTQKLHARGPMGVEALTTKKFIILGDGQIR